MKHLIILFVSFSLISCIQTKNEKKTGNAIALKSIHSTFFDMKYPSDWIIDSVDKDYDLESYFAIDAPVDEGVAVFLIFDNSIDEKEHLDNQVEAHLEKLMKNGQVSYFDHWGKYKGHGAIITGRVMGSFKGEVKIFCHSGDSCSFLSVSQYLNSDKETTSPGFKLIESSFTLKK